MNLLFLGASRNIGHLVAELLLSDKDYSTATLTLLVRRPLAETDSLQPHVASGRVKLVFGDALDRHAVQTAWDAAGGAKCDGILFTIGTPLSDGSFSATKGLVIKTSNLTTAAMLNLLAVIRSTPGSPSPPLIAVSSLGLGEGEARLPFSLRMFYRWFLHAPHVDKLGLEHLLRLAGTNLTSDDSIPTPSEGVLSNKDLEDALPQLTPLLSDVTIVRPAFLMDAPDRLRSPERAFAVGERLQNPRTVSREEVARFIFEELLPGRARRLQWVGKAVDVARLSWF